MPPEQPSRAGRLIGPLAERGLRLGARVADRVGLREAARTTLDRLLAAPLAERVTRQLVQQGVIERVTAELIAGGVPERVVDQVLESRLPEQVIDRLLTEEFSERVVARVLDSPGVEPAAVEVIESDLVDQLTRRVLESEELEMTIDRVAQSPQVRQALAHQGVGLIEDVGRQLSRLARRLDGAVEAPFRWLARRGRRKHPPAQAGAVSRPLAVALDAIVLNAFLFAASVVVALVLSFFGGSGDISSAEAIVAGGVVWLFGAALYLAVFWTTAGQTPGMRFVHLRITRTDGSALSPGDSIRRLVGMILAALPLFLGYALVLFSDRRRGLQDLIAHTEVSYVHDEIFPGQVIPSAPSRLPPGPRGYDGVSQREPDHKG